MDVFIKHLRYFSGKFETCDRFEIIPIIVVECKKNHGLLGRVVLMVDTSKLISNIISEKSKNGSVKAV